MRKSRVMMVLLLIVVIAALAFLILTRHLRQDTGETKRLTPTATFYVMCTPPACKGNEVYYCADECLGGCGTVCATPTP